MTRIVLDLADNGSTITLDDDALLNPGLYMHVAAKDDFGKVEEATAYLGAYDQRRLALFLIAHLDVYKEEA